MRSTRSALIGAVLGFAIALGGIVSPAHATVLWWNDNFGGTSFGADNAANLGSMNDKASSSRNFGYYVTFYEDTNYRGRNFRTDYDWDRLSRTREGLNYVLWWENWNDRISSYRR